MPNDTPRRSHFEPFGDWYEDVCEVCGAHVGWGVEALHLKRCDDHPRPAHPPRSSDSRPDRTDPD